MQVLVNPCWTFVLRQILNNSRVLDSHITSWCLFPKLVLVVTYAAPTELHRLIVVQRMGVAIFDLLDGSNRIWILLHELMS